jgi:predicted RND superfamily exporter protein
MINIWLRQMFSTFSIGNRLLFLVIYWTTNEKSFITMTKIDAISDFEKFYDADNRALKDLNLMKDLKK